MSNAYAFSLVRLIRNAASGIFNPACGSARVTVFRFWIEIKFVPRSLLVNGRHRTHTMILLDEPLVTVLGTGAGSSE
jgi:hypothetical protein